MNSVHRLEYLSVHDDVEITFDGQKLIMNPPSTVVIDGSSVCIGNSTSNDTYDVVSSGGFVSFTYGGAVINMKGSSIVQTDSGIYIDGKQYIPEETDEHEKDKYGYINFTKGILLSKISLYGKSSINLNQNCLSSCLTIVTYDESIVKISYNANILALIMDSYGNSSVKFNDVHVEKATINMYGSSSCLLNGQIGKMYINTYGNSAFKGDVVKTYVDVSAYGNSTMQVKKEYSCQINKVSYGNASIKIN